MSDKTPSSGGFLGAIWAWKWSVSLLYCWIRWLADEIHPRPDRMPLDDRDPDRLDSLNLSFERTMTKQKTHKATKKRFRLTATGKAKHRKAGTSHLAVRKTPKRIRQLRGTKTVETNMERVIQAALRGNSY
jgi:large subunit ribosomal protein L35